LCMIRIRGFVLAAGRLFKKRNIFYYCLKRK
jgi:hypothetical protein